MVVLLTFAKVFFLITLLGFGGVNGVLPLLHEQLVHVTKFISEEQFFGLVGVSQLISGLMLINSATYTGLTVYGITGATVKTILVKVLPSFFILSGAMSLKHYSEAIFSTIREGFHPLVLALLGVGILVLVATVIFPEGSSYPSLKAIFLITIEFFIFGLSRNFLFIFLFLWDVYLLHRIFFRKLGRFYDSTCQRYLLSA